MRFLRTASLFCALLALLSAPAFSSVMTFTDEASWSNATASFSAVSLTPGNYNTTTGIQIPGGPEFVGDCGGLACPGNYLEVQNGGMGPYMQWDTLGTYLTSAFLEITFSTPVTSVAFNLYGGGNQPYNVIVNHGASYSTTAAPAWPSGAFFGLTSTTDAPISVLDISLPSSDIGNAPAINNFDYGVILSAQQPPPDDGPQDTPEVCTLLMIGSGLFFVARLRRRTRPAAMPQAI